MKFISEYRDPKLAKALVAEIHETVTRQWSLMEVCGGQTNTIIRQGIDELLPEKVRLIHGPGCPVCVTPLEQIDRALAIAGLPDVIFTSYGDMLRVPGSETDLLSLRAQGADVRFVYSPLDAVKLAAANPQHQVVFFGVGFETTAPANAMAILHAEALGLDNFSMLISHVLVPPALAAVLQSPACTVQGFLAAGHVCTVMGMGEYEPIASKYKVPIVVTGFEPLDILEGILMVVRQLEEGRFEVENQYARSVRRDGNRPAQDTIQRVFEVGERTWRGIGTIPDSGLHISPAYQGFDAETRFAVRDITAREHPDCIAGDILQGAKLPTDCAAYGTLCDPETPLGAPMVSAEGTCAAYFAARREAVPSP
ncbi:MAG: hydrogenase formation protein HypD [Candidatus Nanopelagicales bacterium]|nr:hydrogenase formation protein HypD [Candidatus Nanopelagicales bacterium]